MSGSNSRGYSFRISAEGMQEFAQDLARLSGQSDQAHAAITRLIQASPELASGLLKAEEATKRAADRTRELQDAQARAGAAAASLPGQMQRAAASMDAMESRTLAARRGVADFRGALELLGAGGVSQALGPVASQIGNVADAFSTASLAARSGTTALGMAIPVLGAVAAAAGGLYAAYQALQAQAASYGTEQERLNRIVDFGKDAQDAYNRAVAATDPLLETAEERAIRQANATRQQAMETLRAAEATNTLARAEAARIANNLAGSISTAGEDPGAYGAMGFGGVSASDRAGRVAFLEEQLRLVRERAERLEQEAADLASRRDRLGSDQGSIIYGRPIGPELPRGGSLGSGGRAAAPAREVDHDAHVRAFQAAQQRLEQQQQAEERRREQQLRNFEKQSLDAFARIGENAMDRIGNSLVNAFVQGERAALNWGNILRGVIASAATDLIKLGLINPFVNSTFGLGRPTLGGAASAMGGGMDLLSMGGSLSGMGSLLGLGGIGGGVSGLLSAPLWGSSAAGAGMFAEASAASMGIANPGALAGLGPSLGATLGVGAMGALGGGVLAGMTGGNSTGGAIGGGLGAVGGFLVGGPVGALIGGAGGGLLGGMIGPRSGPGFYHLGVDAGADGMLSITDSGQKRAGDQLAALQQQTAQEIDAVNRQMAALGVRVSGRAVLGSDRGDPGRASSLAGAAGQFTLTAADARIQGAIDRAGQGLHALGAAQDAATFAQQLDAMRRAVEDAADPIGAIRRQFEGMRDAANRLGFGLDEVNAAQERAIKQAEDQRRQAEDQRRQAAAGTAAGLIGGIADFARSLRTANDNAGNPMSRLAAAESQFSANVQAALSGDLSALGRVQSSAETFRGLSRDVFGTGQGFASAEARIVAALDQIGGISGDQLTASVLAAETRNQTDTLVAALARLQDEVAALRREARQQGANPLAARSA